MIRQKDPLVNKTSLMLVLKNNMEITLLDKNSIRIKGKKAAIVVDPSVKTVGDGVFFLNESDTSKSALVEGCRLAISGPGEYEIGGVKISTIKRGEELVYIVTIDGISFCLAKADAIEKSQDTMQECSAAIFFAGTLISESLITAVSPKIAVLYGEKALDSTKALGKESSAPTKKVQISADKLPEEMQVVVLG